MTGLSVALVSLSACFGWLPWGMFAAAVGWAALWSYIASEAEAKATWHHAAFMDLRDDYDKLKFELDTINESAAKAKLQAVCDVLENSRLNNKKRLTWTEVAHAAGVIDVHQ